MSGFDKKCEICKQSFNLSDRKPLKLPCNFFLYLLIKIMILKTWYLFYDKKGKHTFCRSCLEIRLKVQEIKKCAYCGAPIDVGFSSLEGNQDFNNKIQDYSRYVLWILFHSLYLIDLSVQVI